jgi:hypothetical protein
MSTIVAAIATIAVFAGVSSAVGELLSVWRQRRTTGIEVTSVESPEQRIRRLISALSEAATTVEQIEDEIRERHELAQQLQADVRKYERLREVNQEEVEAVAQVLGGELRKGERRSFLTGFLLNLVFFVLGVGATIVLSMLFGL